ncbi:MAG TPA: hypothetical protein VIL36_21920 [Acidimicrobiales bacterium]
MLQFVIDIDLSGADLDAFDRYEALALGLFAEHGGEVVARVRDTAGRREWHVLRIPTREAFEAFLADPRRTAQADLLARASVTMERHEVVPVG